MTADANHANTIGARLPPPATPGSYGRTGGVRFFDSGEGERTILFIHGLGRMIECWTRQIEALSARFRCIAVDLPGHGGSAPPAEPTVEALSAAVCALLNRLDLRDVVLVRHSMGCRIVTQIWSDAGVRVGGIVYLDGSLFSGSPDQVLSAGGDYIAGAIARAVANGADEATQQGLWINQIAWDVNRAEPILRSITVPVCAVQATLLNTDRTRMSIQPGQFTPWLRLVSDSVSRHSIVRIHGVGHYVHHEAAARVNRLIEEFCDSLQA